MLLRLFLVVLGLGSSPWLSAQTNTHLPSLKYEETNFTATIYPIGTNRSQPLFRFSRKVTRAGNRLDVVREFTYPDGRLAARERVVYEGDTLLSWHLDEVQIHAAGAATIRNGKLFFEYDRNIDTEGAVKKRTEAVPKNLVVSDMLGEFLRDHWQEIAAGQSVKCRYIVVPRTETVGFTFEKEREQTYQGKAVLIVKMSPTSPILSALVDPLYFTIEKAAPHRVFEYQGRTTPKIQDGKKWKDLDAITVFDW